MNNQTPNNVQAWFGADFMRLHPLLRQLYQDGGQLEGDIEIALGRGVAGYLGRLLARSIGVPQQTHCRFRVSVTQTADSVHWRRAFLLGNGEWREMLSVFTLHGQFPDGYWQEELGHMRFRLGVALAETNGVANGWYWQVKSASWCGLPLPIRLFPRSQAFKRIVEEGGEARYQFSVAFVMPLLGLLLSYSGMLKSRVRR